jgi:hypothetical protein
MEATVYARKMKDNVTPLSAEYVRNNIVATAGDKRLMAPLITNTIANSAIISPKKMMGLLMTRYPKEVCDTANAITAVRHRPPVIHV